MNILYIAYSCSPDHGSEDRIGWKIPVNSTNMNHVFVITKQEHKRSIEKYQKQHPELEKIRFFYVDIPAVYKKVFRGSTYSGRLNIWHRRAHQLAEEICKTERIDVIHQITPVEFRSIGDYGNIPDVKFVCGPIGGGEYIPSGLQSYVGKYSLQEGIRKCLNKMSLVKLKQAGILERCDKLLFANQETQREVCRCFQRTEANDPCFTEIGIEQSEIIGKQGRKMYTDACVFLVAGRLIYRKGHDFLLDALKSLPKDLPWQCNVVGTGKEWKHLKEKITSYGLEDKVHLLGKVPFSRMAQIYSEADVLIMPSLRETTGSVLLEALARGLPVITIGQFGGAEILNENAGWRYTGDTKEAFVNNLSKCMAECIAKPQEVRKRGEQAALTAQEHTWDKKVNHYQDIYVQLTKKAGNRNG